MSLIQSKFVGDDTFNTEPSSGPVPDFAPGGGISPISAGQSFVAVPVVITQTTDFTGDSFANISEIEFDTTAASTATFTSYEFGQPGNIQDNATIMGDGNADTISVKINGPHNDPENFPVYGFDGSQLQLHSWTSADKFVITVVAADIPANAYVAINGTSGNDTINMGAALSSYYDINGEAGTNTLKLAGDYSAGADLTTHVQNIQDVSLAGGFNYMLNIGNIANNGTTVTVDASALGSGDTLQLGLGGLDNFRVDGGAGTNDVYLNSENDTVVGGTGTNYVGAFDETLSTGTKIEGAGVTTLELGGADYSGGYSFSSKITNLNALTLDGGESYKLTMNDANVAAGTTLKVDASALMSTDSLTFNGSHETDGAFDIVAGAGLNILTGGAGNDFFEFNGANMLTAADRIDGGGGYGNTIELDGDYSAGLKFSGSTITNIQEIDLAGGHSYKLTLADANVAVGSSLSINGQNLGSGDTLNLNDSKETNAFVDINGGAGNDILVGGSFGTQFYGGLGADTMTGGAGADYFAYRNVAESTSTTHDTIIGFNASNDFLDFQLGFAIPTSIDAAVTAGTLSNSNFDADLAHVIGATQLHAHDAVLFTPSGGSQAGNTFLIVDENGVAGYQAGQDLVIELTSATNMSSFGLSNFTT